MLRIASTRTTTPLARQLVPHARHEWSGVHPHTQQLLLPTTIQQRTASLWGWRMAMTTTTTTSNDKGNSLQEELTLDPRLAKIVGKPKASRGQVIKAVWAYAKEHKLQDPKDGRQINNDKTLQALFGVPTMHGFGMSKYVEPLLGPSSRPRAAKGKYVGNELSDALAAFVGQSVMTRQELVKKMWQYVKENNLERQASGVFKCDNKLKSLLGEPTVSLSTMSQLLGKHVGKKLVEVKA